ncbi:hypothetical protein SprV_0301172300 [Sparganum proliferum]
MAESGPKSPNVQRVVPTEEELRTLPSASYRCHDERDVAFLTKKKVEVAYFYYCPIPSCKHRIETKNGFSKFSRLKQHYQIVHMKKSFQCNTCGQLFATPTTQAYHSKTCGLSYECLVCHRKYRQKKFLNQHARRSGHKISGSGRLPESSTHPDPPNVDPTATPPTKQAVTPAGVQPILLPILVLPLDVPADKISTGAIMSAFSRVLANTCGGINFPSTVTAAQNRPCYLPTAPTENQVIGNFANHPLQSGLLSISAATTNALRDTVTTSVTPQQTSQGRASCAFAQVADVGTATMCHTDACVQTDFYSQSACAHLNKAPPVSVKTGTDNDNISDMFFKMTDFSVGTSPPALISAGNSPPCFISPVAHADTYMTPAKSIQLQYPEMNSNGTMTQPHQFACGDHLFAQKPGLTDFITAPPQNTVEGHFQSQPPPFCHMFSHTAATTTSSCSGGGNHACYTPPSTITPSFCATPHPSPTSSIFSFNPPRSLMDTSQQFSWPEQSRGVEANSGISSEPEYLNSQVGGGYSSRRNQQPAFSNGIPVGRSDAPETQYAFSPAVSWVSLHPSTELPSNELNISCDVSTPTLPAAPKTSTSLCHANSVAVETTVDLMNFNDSNAGNCCWSPADSFSHMQTQTTGDAELDQWLNSVHTQTAFQQTPSSAAASSSTNWLSAEENGVCVGVNTDLRTPDGCNQFV